MKIKHIFKIFTIMMMLALTIFTTGCESQKEKYTKASYDLLNYDREFAKEDNFIWGEFAKNKISKEEKIKLAEKNIKMLENYEKDTKEKLEKMEKIAKGNPELEYDVRLKKEDIDRKVKSHKKVKPMWEKTIQNLKNKSF